MFPLQKYLKYSLLFMGLLILTACGGESSSSDPVTELIDSDGDGVADIEDAFPNNSDETTDSDGDNVGDKGDAFPNDPDEDTDSDGDEVGDNADAFPNDPDEDTDSDGDEVGDNADAFPNDPDEDTDTDGDNVGDNADAFPNDPDEDTDTDGDEVGDNADPDIDGDNVLNEYDAFDYDARETTDTDGDEIGDNADPDIDGDDVLNEDDAFPNDPDEDTDTDGDNVGDNADAFPTDPTETTDSDGDGVGDNADAFDDDPTEQTDTDGDGTGDNADAFDDDPTEQTDSDGDGVGDNADAFDDDATETTDTDEDGVGDNADIDADNDGLIELYTLEQLDWVRNNLKGTSLTDHDSISDTTGCPTPLGCNGYELAADLDFDTNGDGVMDTNDTYYDYDGDGENNGWLPIGTVAFPFSANFDGNDHSISNLYINRTSDANATAGVYIGLFGVVSAEIAQSINLSNIQLDGEVAGREYTGSLIGHINNAGATSAGSTLTISNNTTTVTVSADARIGGLIGDIDSGSDGITTTISNNTVNGEINSTTDTVSANFLGGLIGVIDSLGGAGTLAISNNRVTGDVSSMGENYSGGLIGYIANTDVTITISSNRVDGDVSSSGGYRAGLIGYLSSAGTLTLSNNRVDGDVSGGDDLIGSLIGGLIGYGIVGDNTVGDDSSAIISNNMVTGDVSGYQRVGGLIGRLLTRVSTSATVSNNLVTGDVSAAIDSSVGGLFGDADLQGTESDGTLSTMAISDNLVSSAVTIANADNAAANDEAGALIGTTHWGGVPSYSANYYNTDEGGLTDVSAVGRVDTGNSLSQPEDSEVAGFTLDELQCPVSATDSDCAVSTLYNGWGSVWDFGTADELPGLIIDGVIYRDAEGDGNLSITEITE